MRKRFVLNGRNEHDGNAERYCFDFDVKLNKRGNIEVVIEKLPTYFVAFFSSKKYVFSESGVCISHQPSKKYRYHKVNAELVNSHT